jgi:hypothetical protein
MKFINSDGKISQLWYWLQVVLMRSGAEEAERKKVIRP